MSMKRLVFSLAILIFLVGSVLPSNSNAEELGQRLFFLHHSTGRALLEEGNARAYLSTVNDAKGSNLVLWDHDYNYIGLADIEGDLQGYDYSIPNDDTDPIGLHELWTTTNSARDSLLSRYDVIAFKSCYPACDITSEAMLDQYKQWYLEMRDFFDSRPDKIFIVMSPPPRHRLATNVENADRARQFANWLISSEYLDGHLNMVGFDFYNLLAHPDDGSATRNMLRYDYERSHYTSDSHPNALANEINAPIFIDVLVEAAEPAATSDVRSNPSPVVLLGNHPNPFNPATLITFGVAQSQWVEIQVIDVRGQKIRSLWNGDLNEGQHQILWNGRDDNGQSVSSGLYLYQVKSGSSTVTGKMVLAR
jgi:hypothetical protein